MIYDVNYAQLHYNCTINKIGKKRANLVLIPTINNVLKTSMESKFQSRHPIPAIPQWQLGSTWPSRCH